ncbi:MAG: PIN domain-containing protein [Bryobacteraceae bacterium]
MAREAKPFRGDVDHHDDGSPRSAISRFKRGAPIAFTRSLSVYPRLDWMAPTLEIADIAARLRAKLRLRSPDALQAATAIRGEATAFITNDVVFERVELFETAVLDRFHPNQNS